MFDAIVVGGSFAGLSAALQLARARRNILVIDEGKRRNRFASHSHGFLGQDGRDPAAIAEDARKQLLAYPNVTWLADRAASAERLDNGFAVTGNNGSRHEARTVVLATGIKDGLPDIPGLVVQAVHGDDLADLYRRAILSDARGAFNAAAEPVLDAEAVATRLRAWRLPVPQAVARGLMAATWRTHLQPSPPGWLDLGLSVPTMDSSRAQYELGWRPSVVWRTTSTGMLGC